MVGIGLVALLIVAIAAVWYVKFRQGKAPATDTRGNAFSNPLYDQPAEEGAKTDGYMDIPTDNNNGGVDGVGQDGAYMDVDTKTNEMYKDDDFDDDV